MEAGTVRVWDGVESKGFSPSCARSIKVVSTIPATDREICGYGYYQASLDV